MTKALQHTVTQREREAALAAAPGAQIAGFPIEHSSGVHSLAVRRSSSSRFNGDSKPVTIAKLPFLFRSPERRFELLPIYQGKVCAFGCSHMRLEPVKTEVEG
jgi:hypothetical protein